MRERLSRAFVLMNLLNSLRFEIKCSANLAFYLFSPTSLINTIKHEHPCKILYLFDKAIDHHGGIYVVSLACSIIYKLAFSMDNERYLTRQGTAKCTIGWYKVTLADNYTTWLFTLVPQSR